MTLDLDAFTKYLVHLRVRIPCESSSNETHLIRASVLQEIFYELLDKELDLSFLHDFFGLLIKLKFTAPIETIKAFELCGPEFQALKTHVQEAYANRDLDLQNYTSLLTETLANLARKTNALQSSASDQALAAQSSTCQDARDNAVKLSDEAKQMQEEARRLIQIQEVFEEASSELRPPRKNFEDLNELAGELKLKSELWEAVCEADQYLSACSSDTIRNVDLNKMGVVASHVDSVVENIRQCATQVTGGFELERLEKLQTTLRGLAPVIRDLRNPHLAERHWSKLEHKMQCSLVPASVQSAEAVEVDGLDSIDPDTSTILSSSRLDLHMEQLLEVNAVAHATAIRHVSEEASAEAAIADSFMSVVRTWEVQEIPVDARKDRDGRDVYCIGNCVELASLIEESQVLLRVMDLSTYSLVVQERLPKLLSDLNHTKESLELLQVCQRKWDYTQRLVSIDFARTFPEQAKQLQKHDAAWRSLTLSLSNRSLCLPFGVSTEHRHSLAMILEGFESAAKTLADHLEIKRQVFPAFFQLSDLELATLLSKCRDSGCIPSFLYQCFDNIGRIVFGTRDGFQDILQVTSRVLGEAETIPMGKNLKARGPVEQWLAAVEKRLAEQLRRYTKQSTEMLSRYDSSDFDVVPSLDIHIPIQQATCTSFHGLAVDWEYQLKYRMDDATTVGHECHVEINTLNIPYGFNYLSPHTDIVVTPSSFRSLFSLFACIRHAQGCVLTGPSESGKRTLSTQISSILGRRNFSATLTSYSHATRLLIGALYAGGTLCANLKLGKEIDAHAALIKPLVATLASIEHAVLTQNQIVGLHRSPVTFVPGTAMLVILPSSFRLAMADAEQIRIWTEPLSRFPIVQLDQEYVVEALLSSTGFVDSRDLTKQLLALWQQARMSSALVIETIPEAENPFSFSALKAIIARELHFVPRQTMLDSISSLANALAFSKSTILDGPE
ncbi:LOW QUALITY PROTEIN: Hypothetical protein PHPALM_37795 [Phytophthora palmivora]|uniref:Dynein heavy chain n=1 Tax=Phytophthora palmivora TaxID=4796 RepID=A0A2P4WWI9_9STRA|nr:LOW QUALITY PROTEIN: Hypothetical protein PHPALM_37795 [Phytophthora palmivora]